MEKFKEITGIDFNDFYRENYAYLLTYVKNLNRYDFDLEGIVDEAFTKLYLNIEKFNENKASIHTYLFSISRYILIQKIKSKKIKLVYKPEELDEEYFDYIHSEYNYSDLINEDDETTKEKYKWIRNEINNSKIESYLFYNGYRFHEIHEITGINENTIKSRVYNFKKRMKKKWKHMNKLKM